jgi:hypothetical protein
VSNYGNSSIRCDPAYQERWSPSDTRFTRDAEVSPDTFFDRSRIALVGPRSIEEMPPLGQVGPDSSHVGITSRFSINDQQFSAKPLVRIDRRVQLFEPHVLVKLTTHKKLTPNSQKARPSRPVSRPWQSIGD